MPTRLHGASRKSIARSSACAASSSAFSLNAGPASWKPTGSPSESPLGIEMPGSPASDIGTARKSWRYIASGSDGLRAELEGDGRRRRRRDEVEALERGREVARDQRAHLLRAAVVGVVVARGERVGPEHDPALDLLAEALLARLRVHVQEVADARRAEAVADAVVAREVGRRLGGRDQVVGAERVRGVRQPAGLDGGAELARAVERLLERGEHAGARRPRPRAPRARRCARRAGRCGSAARRDRAGRPRWSRTGPCPPSRRAGAPRRSRRA